MKILHKLGYKTKADYELEAHVRAQVRQAEEKRIWEDKKQIPIQKQHLATAKHILEQRIRDLPHHMTMYDSESHYVFSVDIDDFEFACEKATAVENNAVIRGATAGYLESLKSTKW